MAEIACSPQTAPVSYPCGQRRRFMQVYMYMRDYMLFWESTASRLTGAPDMLSFLLSRTTFGSVTAKFPRYEMLRHWATNSCPSKHQ